MLLFPSPPFICWNTNPRYDGISWGWRGGGCTPWVVSRSCGWSPHKLHWSLLLAFCHVKDFPGGTVLKESVCQYRRCGFDPWVRKSLEKRMAAHSSVLAWEIPWTEKPGGRQSTGLQRVKHHWADEHTHKDIMRSVQSASRRVSSPEYYQSGTWISALQASGLWEIDFCHWYAIPSLAFSCRSQD